MKLIEWREDFLIGLPEVDHEHRELIDGINSLHEQIAFGAATSHVCEVLGGIQSDIAAHFALEEKNMVALGYPGYGDHKADHERLLDDILDIADEVHESGRYDAGELSHRLSDWFGRHFRTQDAQLHRWLSSVS